MTTRNCQNCEVSAKAMPARSHRARARIVLYRTKSASNKLFNGKATNRMQKADSSNCPSVSESKPNTISDEIDDIRRVNENLNCVSA